MAVNTAEKRYSMLNFGLPWWSPLPEVDGGIEADDRLHLLGLYSGISAEITAADPYGLEWTLPTQRLHYTLPENRLHHTLLANRIHHTLPEQD